MSVPLPRSTPTLVAGLVDDAAIFPPGNAPMVEAVTAHRAHRSSWYAEVVGQFVVSDQRLPELVDVTRAEPSGEPLAVSLVVTGGAGAIEPALVWADRAETLEVRSLEVAVRSDAGTPGGLTHNVARVTTALAAAPFAVPAYVELPRPHAAEPDAGWLGGLDVLAGTDAALKLRTGGESAEAHPPEGQLAAVIDAALDRELRFKCTAGLHHAVRRRSPEGYEQHGFLNLLVAVAALLEGAGRPAAAQVLAEQDPARVVEALSGWPAEPPARRWCTSFGSCSVAEPVQDLVALGLLEPR